MEWETRDLTPGTQERPADVHINFHTHTVAVDVTVAHAQTPAMMTREASAPGHALREAEGGKRTNYNGRLRAGCLFVPFAVDDYGHISDAGWALLERLAAHAAEQRSADYRRGYGAAEIREHWLRTWQHRIAWAVRSEIDKSTQRRLALSRRVGED